MIVHRWQAETRLNLEQGKMLFRIEGQEPLVEVFDPNIRLREHRHPFCEVRMIIEGELLVNVAGNQFLLRSGDRMEIPANTKHSYTCQSQSPCQTLHAQKIL